MFLRLVWFSMIRCACPLLVWFSMRRCIYTYIYIWCVCVCFFFVVFPYFSFFEASLYLSLIGMA